MSENNKLNAILNHLQDNVVTYKVPLLSNKKQKIEFRTIRGKDEKVLAVDKEENEDNTELENLIVLLKVLDKCVIKNRIELGDVTIEDFLWLILNLKMKSSGEKFPFTTNCDHCDYRKNKIQLDLTKDVVVTYLDKIKNNVIEVTPNMKIELQHVRVNDLLEILAVAETDEEKIKLSLASMIKQIEINEEIVEIDDLGEKLLVLEEFDGTQLKQFTKFTEENAFGFKVHKEFVCKGKRMGDDGKTIDDGCGKKNIIDVDGFELLLSFFIV